MGGRVVLSREQLLQLMQLVEAVAARRGIDNDEAIAFLQDSAAAGLKKPSYRSVAQFAAGMRAIRLRRNELLGTSVVRDPAWDMLLDLVVASDEQRARLGVGAVPCFGRADDHGAAPCRAAGGIRPANPHPGSRRQAPFLGAGHARRTRTRARHPRPAAGGGLKEHWRAIAVEAANRKEATWQAAPADDENQQDRDKGADAGTADTAAEGGESSEAAGAVQHHEDRGRHALDRRDRGRGGRRGVRNPQAAAWRRCRTRSHRPDGRRLRDPRIARSTPSAPIRRRRSPTGEREAFRPALAGASAPTPVKGEAPRERSGSTPCLPDVRATAQPSSRPSIPSAQRSSWESRMRAMLAGIARRRHARRLHGHRLWHVELRRLSQLRL